MLDGLLPIAGENFNGKTFPPQVAIVAAESGRML
jgi:hypothetical protein